ncbi:T9SS type A sorting domain-containing protein [Aureisphaera galaxeae]|uniref:endo-beta-N-acetylglucosaminidase n=1 Tax=Aureisphaera galaxeae TaxID=1538023 RepID=UPI002350B3E3|nr:T9SS type A sorting domain-containing protein [Aureisphaera galaxeae]MDC8002741.1 T9SS type A sorting domain-containing protein [Aureisphaera galaxeae]
MIKNYILFLSLFVSYALSAQITVAPPYVLSIDELKAWTPTGPTADDALIATQELLPRFVNTDTQFDPTLSNDMEIAYLPDGMGNFANYSEEQDVFNLYNFTNWSYIDKLVWFGGTFEENVQLPSAPWVNTAHKNGVKVYANVFFAPNVFGGTTAILQNFLEQDGNGDFVVIPIMVQIMEHYNFDGWFINEETNTNSATAQLMYEFLRDLTTAVEVVGKDVMWYDAMLLSGNVDWQNRLNANNSPFVQNDEDGNSGNGFEQRVSSNIFINFFWGGTPPPIASRNRAQEIGRSEFEVFTGVDVWPGRNQAPFETGGNAWMGWLHENQQTPYTSLGLFAPNCIFNNSQYSIFNTDPADYANFYSEERHMFAGADRNPRVEDPSGFKGYANWIPAASTITEIPFETNFNTGHGLKKFTEGTETSSDPWHNLNDQDILPTWQFAFSENAFFSASWDFDLAYNGGSSLRIDGDPVSPELDDLLLYKTNITLTPDSKIDIIYYIQDFEEEYTLSLILTFADAPDETLAMDVTSFTFGEWIPKTRLLGAYAGRELATIGVRMDGPVIADANYIVNIGNIRVHEGPGLSVDGVSSLDNALVISYPNAEEILIHSTLSTDEAINFGVYNLQGQLLSSHSMEEKVYRLPTETLSQGVYLVQFTDSTGRKVTKKVLIR